MNKHRMPMSAFSIRAIQREIEQPGTGKTMTRRVAKLNEAGRIQRAGRQWHPEDPEAVKGGPYGQPGDLLAFTEAFGRYGSYSPPGKSWEFSEIVYRADAGDKAPDRWKPPMFMPYWASRYTGLITDVRVERLLDIRAPDAKAEGVDPYKDAYGGLGTLGGGYKPAFMRLWESLHGPGSWEENPSVWVYTFRPIAANVLDVEREPEAYGVAC